MATTSSSFNLTSLDYDGIKASLISFLSSQDAFSDYDFQGSALQVIINLLSYNTHYLGYYLNMISKEMFLDSAQLRQSVVSLAKQLSYTPKSRTASSALINIDVAPSGSNTPPSMLALAKYTPFTTKIDGTGYNFITAQDATAILDPYSNTYSFKNVLVREGTLFIYRYSVSNGVDRYIIPSPNVDTTTISVTIQNSNIDTNANVFTLADTIGSLTSDSLVYFLQEVENNQFQLYFGNDVIGKALTSGNIVIITYQTCNADVPNKASVFAAVNSISGYNNITVTTLNTAFGGAERESIESIKKSAPIAFQTQNRAVTSSDFKSLILSNFPNISAISVWGGQDSVPAQYGKVFISVKPVSGDLTSTDKNGIINFILASKKMLTITPVIVDPDVTFLEITSIVKYNAKLTVTSSTQLANNVANIINAFPLNGFESNFKYSNLTSSIDESDNAITSNLTSVKLQKVLIPVLNTINSFTTSVNANNPILPGTVASTKFICTNDPSFNYTQGETYQFDDDSLGNIRIFKIIGLTKIVVKAKAGTIDYKNGIIVIRNFIPSSIVDNSSGIKLSMVPVYNDVVPTLNNVISIDTTRIFVSIIGV